MKRTTFTATAIAFIVAASTTEAQRPLSLGIAGGASIPTGDFGKAAGTGWHAMATIGLGSIMLPQALRADLGYAVFPFENAGSLDGNQMVGSGTLNLTYRLPMTNSPFSPYVIAGFGWYRMSCSGDFDCGSTIRSGWNAGLGTKFVALGFHGFLESRFHSVNAGTKARFIPVSVGLTL